MSKNLLPKNLSALKVALVHDDLVVQYGGAEKVFMAIAEMFPDAPVYTSMATREWGKRLEGRELITSFMQRLPLKEKLFKFYFLLYPLAFESFNLSDYDLVISSSTRFAHGVITKPETKHVCYMHSPGRMFWEPERYFGPNSRLKTLLAPALSYLRLWDRAVAQRVDHFIANSKNIAGKIRKYYGREASVVHPFVDLERFKPLARSQEPGDYYLVVTRLASWKRVEIVIEAAKEANVPLKVVGGGSDRKRLEDLATRNSPHATNQIEILGRVSDGEVDDLFQNCKALIMTQEEDFGITALEAQTCGKPVIAYRSGGALETVEEGKTGEFFHPQSADALAKVLKDFKTGDYKPEVCRANAERFSKKEFKRKLFNELGKIGG